MNLNRVTKHGDHESKIQSMITHAQQSDSKPKGNNKKRGSIFDLGGPSKGKKNVAQNEIIVSQSENYQGEMETPQAYYTQSGQNNQFNTEHIEQYYTSTQSYNAHQPPPPPPPPPPQPHSEGGMQGYMPQESYQSAPYYDMSNNDQMYYEGGMQYGTQQQIGGYQTEETRDGSYSAQQQTQSQFYKQQGGYYTGNFQQDSNTAHNYPQSYDQPGSYPIDMDIDTTEEYEQNPTKQQNTAVNVSVLQDIPQDQKNKARGKSVGKTKRGENMMAVQDTVSDRTFCEVCDVRFEKESQYWMHCRGLAHYHKVEEMERDKTGDGPDPSAATENEVTGPPSWLFCEPCHLRFDSEMSYSEHVKTTSHILSAEQFEKHKKKHQEEQMSQMAVKNSKWIPAQEKDLTPSDVGKAGSNPFYCEVCNISCTGEKNFEMHMAGVKHMKKVRKAQLLSGMREEPKLDQGQGIPKKKRQSSIQAAFESCREPLVGADYVTEYQKQNREVEPKFACSLCQTKMGVTQVIVHLTGIKHRMKYMKYHYPSNFHILWPLKKSEKCSMAEKMAADVENREGRRNIRLRVELNPFSEEESDTWEDVLREGVRSGLPGDKTGRHLQTFVEEKPGEQNDDEDLVNQERSSLPSVPTLLAVEPRPSRSFKDMDWTVGARDKEPSERPVREKERKGKYYDEWMKYFDQLDQEEEELRAVEELNRTGDPYSRDSLRGRGYAADYGRDLESKKEDSYVSPYEAFGRRGRRDAGNAERTKAKQGPFNIPDNFKRKNDSEQIRQSGLVNQGGKKVEKLGEIAEQAATIIEAMKLQSLVSQMVQINSRYAWNKLNFLQKNDSIVKDENDAEIALNMSNALTQALLNYRMKCLPEEEGSSEMKDRLEMLSEAAKGLKGSAFTKKPPPPPHQILHAETYPEKQLGFPDNTGQYQYSDRVQMPRTSKSSSKRPGYSPSASRNNSSVSINKGIAKTPHQESEPSQVIASSKDIETVGQSASKTNPTLTYPSAKETAKNIVAATMAAQREKRKKEMMGKTSNSSNASAKQAATTPGKDIKKQEKEKSTASQSYNPARATAKSVIAATMAARREIRKQELEQASSSPSVVSKISPNSSDPSSTDAQNMSSNFKAYMSQLKKKDGSGGSESKPKFSVTWPCNQKGNKTSDLQVSPKDDQAEQPNITEEAVKRPIQDESVSDIPATKKSCTGDSPIF